MKKNKMISAIALAVFLGGSGTFVSAAKMTAKKVKTRFFEFPPVPMEKADISKLTFEFAHEGMSLQEKKVATTTQNKMCQKLAKKFGGKGKYKHHYYRLIYNNPDSYLVMKDLQGTMVYSARFGLDMEPVDKYGEVGSCFSSPGSLEDFYKKSNYSGKGFIKKQSKNLGKKAKKVAGKALKPFYQKESVKVFAIKGDASLEQAQSKAIEAYKSIKKENLTAQTRKDLKAAIAAWEKTLEQSDPGNKKARVNRKTTIRLHHNVAVASMYIHEFDQSITHAEKAIGLRGGKQSSTSDHGLETILKKAKRRKASYQKNKAFVSDPSQWHGSIANAKAAAKKITVTALPQSSVPDLRAAYEKFTGVKAKAPEPTVSLKDVLSGKAKLGGQSSYQDQVQYTAAQGYVLMIQPFFGPKLKELPQDICVLEQLNQLHINSNTISQVPPEIGNLKNLKLLSLKSNKIKQLPKEIGKLTNLKKLNLAGNQLNALPTEISGLKNLKVLNLKKNPIAPEEQQKIKQLLPKCKIKF